MIKNCSKCGASYSDSDDEYWCECGDKNAEFDGVCCFCDEKSKYHIDRYKNFYGNKRLITN